MKKFFSLLCATLLVFSASAAPVAQKAQLVKKAPAAVEQMQNVQFEQAQTLNINQLSATPALKVINSVPQTKIGPKDLAAQRHSVAPKKAPQATTYNYKSGIIEVVVTDLSTPTYNQFKLAITQKAKNTAEYNKETLYDNTVELIIDPDEHSIVGTFTTDDYTINSNSYLKSGSNTRYVSYWENSTITIESKGGNQYAITDGLLQVENSSGSYLYKYDYNYDVDALNDEAASKVPFVFTFGEEPTPAKWDTIGKSTVKDGVVAYLLGDTEDAAAYQVTTLQQGTSYKMVNLFGSANPAYNKIKDLASYKKAEIVIDATDANNVTLAKQNIGWTGVMFQEVYEIEASNGKLENGVITFAAADIKFYEDGTTPYGGYSNLVITLPKDEPEPIALADRYNATGLVSTDGGATWNYAPDWVATVGADQYGPCITNLIPQGPFTTPVALNYVTVGNQIILPATALTQVSQTELIYAMDITDFLNGGTGDIVLNVAQDGNISANQTHMYGYARAKFNASTFAPTEMTGVYHIYTNLAYSIAQPITERDTVKVNLNAITIEEDVNSQTGTHRGWLFEGQDTDTLYIVQVLGAEKYGTFSYADGTLGQNFYNIIPSNGQGRCQFTEGTVTIAEEADGIHLTGEFVGQDEKAYVFTWFQKAGVLTYDTDAPFDATFAYSDMSADLDEGVIYISATNAENLTMGLVLFTDPAAEAIPAGAYVISDTEEAGTALKSGGVVGGFLTECFAGVRTATGISDCWFIVDGTVTLSYDEYDKLKVVVDGTNSWGQPVTALVQYVKLEPKSTVDIADADLFIYDGYIEQYGIMNFYGANADGFEFDLYAYSDTVAGDFLKAIDFADCELTLADGTPVGVIDLDEFKVELDGKDLTLTAKLLGSDTIQYNITAYGYLGYIDGDAKEAYAGAFTLDDITINQVVLSKENYIFIQGANVIGDNLALVVKGELEDGAIAAGEYTEVMATSWTEAGNINPSYVINYAAAWFIQSGKLTVAEDGSMEFEGVNSYDADVLLTITVPEHYLVGFINGSSYGIEDDIDNLGDYKFVDGKVTVTFEMTSYVQVKNNDKLILGTEEYVAPVAEGSAIILATGTEKIGVNAGEYEFTLNIAKDGTKTLNYVAKATGLNNVKANVKAAKHMINGQIVIVRENKEYNILGTAL